MEDQNPNIQPPNGAERPEPENVTPAQAAPVAVGNEQAPASEPAHVPGHTVEPHSSAPAGPPPKVVVSSGGSRPRRQKLLLALLLIIILAIGGWLLYDKVLKSKPAKQATQNKDIPLLKIGMNAADYGQFYPKITANEYSYIISAQIFEGLVRYENKSQIVPVLASNWTNPNSTTWVFNLEKGVKFHDGNTMTAKDVKYSLDTIIASGDPGLVQTYASTIASSTVVNDYTIKITTKQPDPTLLNKLAWLYVIDSKLPKGANPTMAGTGPYELKPGTKPTSTSVQLVAASNYHGSTPTTKALDFESRNDADSLIKAFKAGQFNIIGPIPPNTVNKVKGASEFISYEPNVDFLGFNTVKKGPLQKKEVREAIRYAVNANAIGKAARVQESPLSQVVPESIPGYNPAIKPYQQDLDKAKQLLKQAGYPKGVTITLSTSSDPNEVNEVAKELKAAGITLKVNNYSDFDKFINALTSGQTEMFLVDYGSDTLDGLDVYQSTVMPFYYANPKLDDALNSASTETNPSKRLQLLQQAATIVDQNIPVVPLYEENDIWLMDKPYVLHQDLPSAYISVYFYKAHN